MPIFEYSCDDCGTKFEKLVRRMETVKCPSCGDEHLTTEYSTFAAHASAGKAQASSAGNCGAEACGQGFCGSGLCGSGMSGVN